MRIPQGAGNKREPIVKRKQREKNNHRCKRILCSPAIRILQASGITMNQARILPSQAHRPIVNTTLFYSQIEAAI